MGLFGNLLYGILHLGVVGIDLVTFFLVVRLLAARWPLEWLKAFDRVGAPIVDGLQRAIGKRLGIASFNGSSQAIITVVMLVALGAIRMVLASFVR